MELDLTQNNNTIASCNISAILNETGSCKTHKMEKNDLPPRVPLRSNPSTPEKNNKKTTQKNKVWKSKKKGVSSSFDHGEAQCFTEPGLGAQSASLLFNQPLAGASCGVATFWVATKLILQKRVIAEALRRKAWKAFCPCCPELLKYCKLVAFQNTNNNFAYIQLLCVFL